MRQRRADGISVRGAKHRFALALAEAAAKRASSVRQACVKRASILRVTRAASRQVVAGSPRWTNAPS
jgi:hypothetical protein